MRSVLHRALSLQLKQSDEPNSAGSPSHLPEIGVATMKDRSHDDAMADLFQGDPQIAAATLDAILADGDQGELLVTLRQMTKAFGGLPAVAKSAELNPTQLYRTLSETGNPELRSLNALLRSMGMRLSVQPLEKAGSPAAS